MGEGPVTYFKGSCLSFPGFPVYLPRTKLVLRGLWQPDLGTGEFAPFTQVSVFWYLVQVSMLIHPSPCWYWRKHPAWFQAPWTQVLYYLSNWLTQVGVVGRLRYWCYCRRGPLGIKHWATGLWGCNLRFSQESGEHGMVFTGKSSKPGSCKGEVQTPPDWHWCKGQDSNTHRK